MARRIKTTGHQRPDKSIPSSGKVVIRKLPTGIPGLDAIIRGLGLVIQDDHELLRFTERVYDGLYAWVQRITR